MIFRILGTMLLTLLLTGCAAMHPGNRALPKDEAIQKSDISFGPQPRQKLDVYQPVATPASGDIVIYLYGGHWQEGNKDDYRFIARALTAKGFIAVVPNYRLYPEVTFPAFVEDAALVVKWVHDHAKEIGGDPKRIFLIGHSAGAHIAALVTLDARYLKAVGLERDAIAGTITLAAPFKLIQLSKKDHPVFSMEPGDVAPFDAEPANFVDGKAPPMLILHGENDRTVAPINAPKMTGRIRAQGGDVTSILYTHTGHVDILLDIASKSSGRAPVLKNIEDFIECVNGHARD